jgi:hypothetical protein
VEYGCWKLLTHLAQCPSDDLAAFSAVGVDEALAVRETLIIAVIVARMA